MEIKKQPLFSIIIPTFNRPERLRSCLQSISDIEHAHDAIQTIVVNDGSRLPYDEFIESFHEKMELVYLKQKNRGPAAARNHGANHATGNFLVFLDDDCTLPSEWLHEAQARIHSDCIIGGRTMNCLTDNLFSQASQVLIDYLYKYYNNDSEDTKFLTSNNMIIPRDIFDKLGGFDLDFSDAAAEDRDFCDRLLHSGYQIKHRPEIVIHHYHEMRLSSYIRQHFKYGYSAQLYHKKRANRICARMRIEPPGFYVKLLLFPLHERLPKALTISLLLLIGQAANALGFWKAKLMASTGQAKATC
jgi:GT2 family glycosyltransferase